MTNQPFAFTDKDDELLKSGALTDPMGTLAVWPWYGRQLVPHLTEQTTVLKGFNLLCIIFKLYEEYFESRSDKQPIGLPDFYILIEQMFAFSVYFRQEQWPLPGIRGIIFNMVADGRRERKIDLPRNILGNQIGNGTWGLYRGAAIRAGLLNDEGYQLADDVTTHIEHTLQPHEINIFNAVDSIAKKEKWEIDCNSALGHALIKAFQSRANYNLLFSHLIKKYSFVSTTHDDSSLDTDIEYRVLFEMWLKESRYQKMKTEIDSVITCEDVTGTIDSVFSLFFSCKNKKVSEIKEALDKARFNLKSFVSAINRIMEFPIPAGHGEAYRRYQLYIKHFKKTESMDDFITSFLECHADVITNRGGNPWIFIENEMLKTNVEYAGKDDLQVVPGKGWMHDYYIWPLRSIQASFRKYKKFRKG